MMRGYLPAVESRLPNSGCQRGKRVAIDEAEGSGDRERRVVAKVHGPMPTVEAAFGHADSVWQDRVRVARMDHEYS